MHLVFKNENQVFNLTSDKKSIYFLVIDCGFIAAIITRLACMWRHVLSIVKVFQRTWFYRIFLSFIGRNIDGLTTTSWWKLWNLI